MAGHSKFKNIMHRKGAQDRMRAKLFSRLSKEISVAVKLGGNDIDSNFRLKSAINSAKTANVPKDNIMRAIKKGEGNDQDLNYEEVFYEGYGPGGIAIIVDAMTNNKNRTASEIRTIFSKNGGQLADSGSVSYNFKKIGKIIFNNKICSEEKIFNFAIENGSIDFESNDEEYIIYCDLKNYNSMVKLLTDKFETPKSFEIIRKSKDNIKVESNIAKILLKLIEELEDNEDVQNISSNFEMNEEAMNKLIN